MYSSEQEHILCLRAQVFERHWRETVLLQRVLHAWSEFIKRIKKSQYIVRGVIHQSLRTPRSICSTEYIHKLHGVHPRRKYSVQLKEHCRLCLLRHVVSAWLRFVDKSFANRERQWEEQGRLRQQQEDREAAQKAEQDRLRQEQEDREAAQRTEEEERRTEDIFVRVVKKRRKEKHNAFGILHELGCDQDSDSSDEEP